MNQNVRRANAKTKICTKCLRRKELEQFQPDVRYRYGVKSQCRLCLNAYMQRKQFAKNYAARNKEKIRAYHKEWKAKNKDRYDESRRVWVRKNKKKVLSETRRYQAAKINRTPKWVTKKERAAIRKFYENCPPGFEVDHIIPLRGKNVSGLHVLSNLQYLKVTHNRRKSNR